MLGGKRKMIYSVDSDYLIKKFGAPEAVKMLFDAGFPAVDMGICGDYSFALGANGRALAKRLRAEADARGKIFNQAHAPFGGGYENYTTKLIPTFPEVFEFASILGVKTIVTHPIQNGRYYGNEERLFEENMRFYESIAPLARDFGVKIAIENMYNLHPVNKTRKVDDVCADPYEHCRYFDALNAPDLFTLCLDVGHVALCDREPEDSIRILGRERLGALHVHDVNYISDMHTLPGTAKLNWEAICRSLGEIDYKGEFTLEAACFQYNFPLDFMPTVLKFMNDTAKMYSDKVDCYRKGK